MATVSGTVPSSVVSSGSTSGGTLVNPNGSQTVTGSGIWTSLTITGNGFQNAISGGTVIDTIVNGNISPGSPLLEALAGGVVSGGTVIAGREDASSGGTVLGGIIEDSGSLTVLAGGTAIGVNASNAYLVASGAGAVLSGGTTTNSGGGGAEIPRILDGAVASGVTITGNNDQMQIYSGGTGINNIVSSGAAIAVGLFTDSNGGVGFAAGTGSGSTVLGGGREDVAGGGVTTGTLVSGGTDNVAGSSLSATIVGNGVTSGVQTVGGFSVATLGTQNGFATDAVISSGGIQIVRGVPGNPGIGGTAFHTVVDAGGVMSVFSSGVESGGTVNSGGVMIISNSILSGVTNVESGGRIDLTSATGAGTITADGVSGITGDQSQLAVIEIETQAATASPQEAINDFGSGDAIDFRGIGGTAFSTTSGTLISGGTTIISGIEIIESGNVLTVSSGGATYTLNVPGIGNFGATLFSDGSGGLLFEVCFAEGTLIATPDGETTVERLAVGDLVQTLEGPKPVKWLGHRKVDVNTLRNPDAGRLVRIRRGAFGEGVPHTDLLITQEHSVFVDGVFIPVRLLLNGGSIQRDRFIDRYTYYHVELEQHGVLLANGLTTESYLDTGNRAQFQNAPVTGLRTHGFDAAADVATWRDDAAAPLAVDAARVKPVWDRLAARSEHMGYQRPAVATSDEPELCLVIGDRLIRAVVPDDERIRKQRYFFELPADLAASSETLVGRLRSRSAVPADAEPWLDDRRRLGVMVESLALFWTARGVPQVIDMQDPTLQDGWWAPEVVLDWSARWTNGDAAVPIAPGTRAVEVMVCGTLPYRLPVDHQARRVVHL